MKLIYTQLACTDCGACDHHYEGIREVAKNHAVVGFSRSTWHIIAKLVLPAVAACKTDALRIEEDN